MLVVLLGRSWAAPGPWWAWPAPGGESSYRTGPRAVLGRPGPKSVSKRNEQVNRETFSSVQGGRRTRASYCAPGGRGWSRALPGAGGQGDNATDNTG